MINDRRTMWQMLFLAIEAGCIEQGDFSILWRLCIESPSQPKLARVERWWDSLAYLLSYTLCLFEAFPSRGNEKYREAFPIGGWPDPLEMTEGRSPTPVIWCQTGGFSDVRWQTIRQKCSRMTFPDNSGRLRSTGRFFDFISLHSKWRDAQSHSRHPTSECLRVWPQSSNL